MNLLLVLVLLQAPPDIAKMPSEFLGEPKTIEQMRIDDSYWVPAHCLYVDAQARCWLDPNQLLDEKSDHLIKVERRKSDKVGVYFRAVIYKHKLLGWRWKLIKDRTFDDKYIPVQALCVDYEQR